MTYVYLLNALQSKLKVYLKRLNEVIIADNWEEITNHESKIRKVKHLIDECERAKLWLQ